MTDAKSKIQHFQVLGVDQANDMLGTVKSSNISARVENDGIQTKLNTRIPNPSRDNVFT